MYHLMASRLWRKQFLDRKPFPSSEKDMPEMIQKVIKEVLGSVFKNKGENDEWWMMINDERWMAMTNVKLEIHSFRNLQRFVSRHRSPTSRWFDSTGQALPTTTKKQRGLPSFVVSDPKIPIIFWDHFFWCRKKHPHQIHVTWYVTCIIHFCIIISQMVASTRRFWCQLNYFFLEFSQVPYV